MRAGSRTPSDFRNMQGLAEGTFGRSESGEQVAGPKPDRRILYPHFSKPPIRIQALELLRAHIVGDSMPSTMERDLNNAIEFLRFEKDEEVLRALAHVASSSPFLSVRKKANEILQNF